MNEEELNKLIEQTKVSYNINIAESNSFKVGGYVKIINDKFVSRAKNVITIIVKIDGPLVISSIRNL